MRDEEGAKGRKKEEGNLRCTNLPPHKSRDTGMYTIQSIGSLGSDSKHTRQTNVCGKQCINNNSG